MFVVIQEPEIHSQQAIVTKPTPLTYSTWNQRGPRIFFNSWLCCIYKS